MAYQKNIISESLELPSGKTAMSMPYSHYRNLAKKHGYVKVSRSLGQLAAWNAHKNPKVAEFARDVQKKLKADFGRSESVEPLMELGFGKKAKEKKAAKQAEADAANTAAQKEKQRKIVDECMRMINRELGMTLKPNYDSYQEQDPDMSNFPTFELSDRGSNGEIHRAAQERELKWMYSKRGRAIIINVADQYVQLSIPAQEEKISAKEFTPTKENPQGFQPITSLSKMIKARQIKYEDGKIIPYDSKDTIFMTKEGEFWVGPEDSIDKGSVEYKYMTTPQPKVIIRI